MILFYKITIRISYLVRDNGCGYYCGIIKILNKVSIRRTISYLYIRCKDMKRNESWSRSLENGDNKGVFVQTIPEVTGGTTVWVIFIKRTVE